MRLIDADAFEAELNERVLPILIERYGRDEALRGLHFSFRDCICNIQTQPTIQLEIIRCKDCKHYDPNDHCYLQGAEADDFCSYAERREE